MSGNRPEQQCPESPIRQGFVMRSTRKLSRFVAAFAGAVFHVVVLGDLGDLGDSARAGGGVAGRDLD